MTTVAKFAALLLLLLLWLVFFWRLNQNATTVTPWMADIAHWSLLVGVTFSIIMSVYLLRDRDGPQ